GTPPCGGSPAPKVVHAEQLRGVGPGRDRLEAGAGGEPPEIGDRVFVRVLGMDQLAGGEAKAASGHAGDLVGEALDVQLDPPLRVVVEGVVREAVEIDIAAELVVDAHQQVQVKRGVKPGRIVVGGVK